MDFFASKFVFGVIMAYTKKYFELENLFNPGTTEMDAGDGIKIKNNLFVSNNFSHDIFSANDHEIKENITFSYPVFIPSESGSRKVILLLHGLNERSWNKYLPWAYYLCRETNSYVILFPISFHINRSPGSWKDPRIMTRLLLEKSAIRGTVRNSCFANIALSNRLTDDPRRFLKSGYQTVCDLTNLMQQISVGSHPVIPEGSHVNIFAYSIGAFLAEIIMMADPGGLFSDSSLFMFCGGSVFSNMKGESKLIMDKLAYEKVYNYYMEVFEEEIVSEKGSWTGITAGSIGLAFRSMIDLSRFKEIREKALKRLRDQLCFIGLINDTVIPVNGIAKTLNPAISGNCKKSQILDFPFPYSHENPFPLLKTPTFIDVDNCFEKVFEPACRFLG